MEERHQSSIEHLLVEMGIVKNETQNSAQKIDALVKQVTQQNTRVGKLERWQSYITGGLTILAVLVVPIIVKTLSSYLNSG